MELDSPFASGSTTPTRPILDTATPTNTLRKPKAFIDLTPISGFFKARYPSSSRSNAKSEHVLDEHIASSQSSPNAHPSPGHDSHNGSTSSDEECDRQTIRAPPDRVDGKVDAKTHGKPSDGHINGYIIGPAAPREKAINEPSAIVASQVLHHTS